MYILDTDNPAPLYQQLYSQIRERILSGRLPADSRLPSVRHLAAELSTSRNTVEGAYQELYAEGYIYSRPRSGYFISALDQEAAPLSLVHKPRKRAPLPAPPPHYDYDFHPARLVPESFPAPLWRKLFTESLRESSRDLV
ncbi:winged helix-turn-helix domain-containing protein [Desulfuromonas sp.]|uniref:winged helix-turn-helix domain-containing protein n=1 Tax=Desulfuromonas sp. TaxID=892 RepID=UPI0025B9C599|nr:winged helix-turn-helix domain-containing protein [Desulfuromonas sp.]